MMSIRERKLSAVYIVSHAMIMMAFSPYMIEGLPLGGSLRSFLNDWLGITDSQSIGDMPPMNGSPCFPPGAQLGGSPTSTAWQSQKTQGNTVVSIAGSKSSSSSSYTSNDPPSKGSSGTDCGDFGGMDKMLNSSGLGEISALPTSPLSSGDNMTQASNATELGGGINPGGAAVSVSDGGTDEGGMVADDSQADLGTDLYGSKTADGAVGNSTTSEPIGDGGGQDETHATNMDKDAAAASADTRQHDQVNSNPGVPKTDASMGSSDPSPMPTHDDGGGGGKAASPVQHTDNSDKRSSSPATQSADLSTGPSSTPATSDDEEDCGDDGQHK